TPTGGLLANLQADFTAGTANFATFLQAVETAITNYTSWSTFITQVESAWTTYSTTASDLAADEVFTIQQLLNSMLGIHTSTGLMNPSNVANVLGTGSLGADVQAILDYVANALGHSGTGHSLTDIESSLGLIPQGNINGLGSIWTTLFGTSSPTGSNQIQQSAINGLTTTLNTLLPTS